MLKFDQSLSRICDSLHRGFQNTLGAHKNCDRCTDMIAVMFPDIASNEEHLKKYHSGFYND